MNVSVGDILEARIPTGFAYLQYVGTMSRFGRLDVFRVFDGIDPRRLSKPEVLGLRTAYFISGTLSMILDHPDFSVVAHAPEESPGVPAFRHGIGIIVENEQQRFIRGYTDGLQDMPELVDLPPDVIIERLTLGWRPADDYAALEAAAALMGRKLHRTAKFWISFDSEDEAAAASTDLELDHFTVSRVKFKLRKFIQIEAETSLGDDLLDSKSRFEERERVVLAVAVRHRGKKVKFLVL
jgi:hypothetical protein